VKIGAALSSIHDLVHSQTSVTTSKKL